jgi:hypothetical protein
MRVFPGEGRYVNLITAWSRVSFLVAGCCIQALEESAMPEQPPDPLHYDMKIPPEPDPEKQRGPEEPPSDNDENASNEAKDTNVVRGDDKPQARRETKDR